MEEEPRHLGNLLLLEKRLRGEMIGCCVPSMGMIWVDPRLNEQSRLYVVMHELVHWLDPERDEDEVILDAAAMADLLWRDGWRNPDKYKL